MGGVLLRDSVGAILRNAQMSDSDCSAHEAQTFRCGRWTSRMTTPVNVGDRHDYYEAELCSVFEV